MTRRRAWLHRELWSGCLPPSDKRQIEIARAVLGEHLSDEVMKTHSDQVKALARTGISAEEILARWRAAGL